MRRYLLVLLTGLSVFFAGCGRDGEQAAAGQVIQNFDANGYARRTVLHGVPQRVLILYPGAAEAMLELGFLRGEADDLAVVGTDAALVQRHDGAGKPRPGRRGVSVRISCRRRCRAAR